MANPIFSRSSTFNQAQPAYARAYNQGYAQQGYAQQGYGYPQQGQPYGQPQWAEQSQQRVMTFDDVIAKTTITLLMVMGVAALSWMFIPSGLALPALIVSALVGFITVMIVSMRRSVSPVGVLFYALVEGVFVGIFSKVFASFSVGSSGVPVSGVVTQAILGTFVAAGATLAAYKFFNIRVGNRFRKMVMIGTVAFMGVMLVNFGLALFGVNTGLRGFGVLGLVVALLGAALAVFNLVMDFDMVENGVRNGAPASESWRAALGITVTMVWLYTEILRILSYFRSN